MSAAGFFKYRFQSGNLSRASRSTISIDQIIIHAGQWDLSIDNKKGRLNIPLVNNLKQKFASPIRTTPFIINNSTWWPTVKVGVENTLTATITISNSCRSFWIGPMRLSRILLSFLPQDVRISSLRICLLWPKWLTDSTADFQVVARRLCQAWVQSKLCCNCKLNYATYFWRPMVNQSDKLSLFLLL